MRTTKITSQIVGDVFEIGCRFPCPAKLQSGTGLPFGQVSFEACTDLFMREHFSTLDLREALQILEDKAVNDVADDDVARYSVVRVADEIVVNLMAKACGADYADASRDVVVILFADVPVPVASPRTLIRTKNTIRPSDAADRQFLQVLIDEGARARHDDGPR